jgi:pyruvate-formate lyase-activating enzyme
VDIVKTKKRVITRRAVLWLGQTCNQRCYFCYFINRINDGDHPEHAFMTLAKAKAICTTLRGFYGCTAIDIQGGEPTIHPDILELVAHCRAIGLQPTLITNGLVLARPGVLEKYKDAGIRDFLVSLHGVGEVHDQVVGREGAYADIIAAIDGMRELGIPFRFNCTMSEPVVPLLPDIARKAVETGAYAANFIAFNPFGDQVTGVRTATNVPRYSHIRAPLAAALDLLEEAGVEANVRYLPLCMAEDRHRKSLYNFQQLSYDTHEWDYQSWLWTMMQSQMMRDGDPAPPFRMGPLDRRLSHQPGTRVGDLAKRHPVAAALFFGLQRLAGAVLMRVRGKDAMYRREARLRAALDCNYQYHDACLGCGLKDTCDGFHGDYADLFGTDEAKPITGMPPVQDPRYFIRHQEKVVEPEDGDWAL